MKKIIIKIHQPKKKKLKEKEKELKNNYQNLLNDKENENELKNI